VRAPFELVWQTPPEWARAALAEPLALLSDHAHCELGAAAAAQSLLARHPQQSGLVERLSAHALDELRHFRQVHRVLLQLGGSLESVRKNPYAEGLLAGVERGERNLLDRLLVAALIERRSLERFQLLAAAAAEPIARLYLDLAPSEAGHATLFVELAQELFPAGVVEQRLQRWLGHEAALVRSLPFAPRMHSGPAPLEFALSPGAGSGP